MPKNDQQLANETFDAWAIQEILAAKARWLHHVFRAVLPAHVYECAAMSKDLAACSQWAKDQGYRHVGVRSKDGTAEDRVMKGPDVVAVFRPFLTGPPEDRYLEIYATVNGVQIQVVSAPPANN